MKNKPAILKQYSNIDDLVETEDGVCKLLKSIDIKKVVDPDSAPNIALRQCAQEVAPHHYLTRKYLLNTSRPQPPPNSNRYGFL